MMKNFQTWLYDGKFTAHGQVFDVGTTTRKAIDAYTQTGDINTCGCADTLDNGNGALMRTLPLAFLNLGTGKKTSLIIKSTILTHAHTLNQIACLFFSEVVEGLLHGDKCWLESAYSLITFLGVQEQQFSRIPYLKTLDRAEIRSTGYVIDTLEAALWCLTTTKSYPEAVLTAVNLGGDTDTIGAITGGLAGIQYGLTGIPTEWITQTTHTTKIKNLTHLTHPYTSHP
jgi:ADP-ribosylglycohydrolase